MNLDLLEYIKAVIAEMMIVIFAIIFRRVFYRKVNVGELNKSNISTKRKLSFRFYVYGLIYIICSIVIFSEFMSVALIASIIAVFSAMGCLQSFETALSRNFTKDGGEELE